MVETCVHPRPDKRPDAYQVLKTSQAIDLQFSSNAVPHATADLRQCVTSSQKANNLR